MTLKSMGAASLLALSLLTLAGCDQAEKSARQLMNTAAESAKQAIDDTHKAAEQVLSDATKGLNNRKDKPADDESNETSSQEI